MTVTEFTFVEAVETEPIFSGFWTKTTGEDRALSDSL